MLKINDNKVIFFNYNDEILIKVKIFFCELGFIFVYDVIFCFCFNFIVFL